MIRSPANVRWSGETWKRGAEESQPRGHTARGKGEAGSVPPVKSHGSPWTAVVVGGHALLRGPHERPLEEASCLFLSFLPHGACISEGTWVSIRMLTTHNLEVGCFWGPEGAGAGSEGMLGHRTSCLLVCVCCEFIPEFGQNLKKKNPQSGHIRNSTYSDCFLTFFLVPIPLISL